MSINNWSIKFKLQLLTVVFGVGLLITGIESFNTISELKSGLDEIGEVHLKSVYYLLELDKDLYQALSGILNATQYPSDSPEFKEYDEYYHKQVETDVPKKWQQGYLTLKNEWLPEEKTEIAGFEAAFDEWKNAAEELLLAFQNPLIIEADREKLKAEVSGRIFDDMRDHVNELSDGAMERSEENISDADVNNRRSKTILIITMLASLSVSLMLAAIISKSMLNPIRQVITGLRDITKGDGDLSARLALDSQDEIGELAKEFDTFVEKLEGQAAEQKVLQGQVQESTHGLSAASKHLTEVTVEIAEKSTSIADMSAMVAAASEEMSTNMDTIAQASQASQDNMNSVAGATEEMTATVSEIAQNAEQARGVTAEAVSNVAAASIRVDKLGIAANEISKVTDTIIEIAEQTKLLALNATIEAARAGEAGKGFAVVANEVKELAKQTNDATADISQKIQAIQDETSGTVDEIGSIQTVIDKVSDIVNTIATAVEEQNVTTQDIAGNISVATSGMTDVVNNVTQAATAAREVASNIATVNTDVSKIQKVGQDLKTSTTLVTDTGEQLRDVADRLNA